MSVWQTLILYFTAMALWLSPGSPTSVRLDTSVIEEEPKATKNVDMLHSWAARDNQTSEGPWKRFKDTLKSISQACQGNTRTHKNMTTYWGISREIRGKVAADLESTQSNRSLGEQQGSSKALSSHRKCVNSTCSQTCSSWVCPSPHAWVRGHWGQWATAPRRKSGCACTGTCVLLFSLCIQT